MTYIPVAHRYETCRSMLQCAFDLGITHFDLANNYGLPPGSAEEMFGRVFKQDFITHRDELLLSQTIAGKKCAKPPPFFEGGMGASAF